MSSQSSTIVQREDGISYGDCVERITFYHPENGTTVPRLRLERQRGMHALPKSLLEPAADRMPLLG
jgi:hypothetical protein